MIREHLSIQQYAIAVGTEDERLSALRSNLVWFGLTWSLELYQQTNARLWRQGQTANTVVIQHIITTEKI